MTVQRSCHSRTATLVAVLTGLAIAGTVHGDTPVNDYPTIARVEYVNDCVVKAGKLASLYQCSCAIDRIATRLKYDDFVEAGTLAKYAQLPGERSGVFRDSDQVKSLAKLYRDTEAEAWKACGLEKKD
jgi:hypothetical protein